MLDAREIIKQAEAGDEASQHLLRYRLSELIQRLPPNDIVRISTAVQDWVEKHNQGSVT